MQLGFTAAAAGSAAGGASAASAASAALTASSIGAAGGLSGAAVVTATATQTAVAVASLANKAWLLQAGVFAGTMAAGYLFPGENAPDSFERVPQLADAQVIRSAFGSRLPVVYGNLRVAAVMLWFNPNINVQTFQDEISGGGFLGGLGGGTEIKTKNYLCDLALGFCEGPARITKLFANADLLWETGGDLYRPDYGTLTFYDGTESQNSDPDIEAAIGESAPFRGVTYVAMRQANMTRLGANQIPNFRAEVEPL